MSDVITKPGLYRQQNGRPADVKWVGDGKALGFDSNGEETAWWTATGKWTVEAPDDFGFHITGPWIPAPPEPPAGFVVMPKEYGYVKGDVKWNSLTKSWRAWGSDYFFGMSAAQLDARYKGEAPFYIASPIPKPFSISEHGPGVYENRDGKEAVIDRHSEYQERPWSGIVAGDLVRFTWLDDGTHCSHGCGDDLVRYLRPLPKPKPAVDPVWRELGPDEPIVDSDQFAFRDDTSNVHDDSYFVDSFDSMVGQTVRQLNQQYQGFGGRIVRRRVAPVAQSEWVPTNELRWEPCNRTALGSVQVFRNFEHGGTIEMPTRLVQKWTNGTDSEWRPVKVDG